MEQPEKQQHQNDAEGSQFPQDQMLLPKPNVAQAPSFTGLLQDLELKHQQQIADLKAHYEKAQREIIDKQLIIETSLMADFAEHKKILSQKVEEQGEQVRRYLTLLDEKLTELDYASRQAFAFYETDLKKRFERSEQNIQIVQEELQDISVNRRQLVNMIKQLAQNIEDGSINF